MRACVGARVWACVWVRVWVHVWVCMCARFSLMEKGAVKEGCMFLARTVVPKVCGLAATYPVTRERGRNIAPSSSLSPHPASPFLLFVRVLLRLLLLLFLLFLLFLLLLPIFPLLQLPFRRVCCVCVVKQQHGGGPADVRLPCTVSSSLQTRFAYANAHAVCPVLPPFHLLLNLVVAPLLLQSLLSPPLFCAVVALSCVVMF
eukprot:GHVU01133132.1.p1 GENE.GHVU01133132.1~~GHVU01133132.1.p1  ORF type:complete len:202 (+),score=9.24 GHVU01133132.1:1695-2300(+)